MMELLIEICGWAGMILLLLSYFLLSMKKMESDTTMYQGMNILGAFLLACNTLYHSAIPSTLLNAVWIVIGIIALARILREKNAA